MYVSTVGYGLAALLRSLMLHDGVPVREYSRGCGPVRMGLGI